jgi:hypothetical protein
VRVVRAAVVAADTASGAGSAPLIGGTLRDAVAGCARARAAPGARRVDGTLVRALGVRSEEPSSTLPFSGVRWAQTLGDSLNRARTTRATRRYAVCMAARSRCVVRRLGRGVGRRGGRRVPRE